MRRPSTNCVPGLSGATSLTCGDPLVSCYDAASSNGLVFINGYSLNQSSGAPPNDPKVRSVTLSSTCFVFA